MTNREPAHPASRDGGGDPPEAALALRLRALDALAAGLAHEMNQPLNALRMGASLLEMSLERDRPFPKEQLLANYRALLSDIERLSGIVEKFRERVRRETRNEPGAAAAAGG